jgi:hypothetical protein
MRIAREARVAALFTTSANYAGSHVITKAGGSEWDAVGVINTVQPITDIESMITTVTADAFVTRDMLTVVIPEPTFNKAIRHNSAIRDYFKYTIGGVNTPELLAALLGVKEVLIARTADGRRGPAERWQRHHHRHHHHVSVGRDGVGRRHSRATRPAVSTPSRARSTGPRRPTAKSCASPSTRWPISVRKACGSKARKRSTRRSSPTSPAESSSTPPCNQPVTDRSGHFRPLSVQLV